MADTETETNASTASMPKATLTEYVILAVESPNATWEQRESVKAASAEAAIRRTLDDNGGEEGTYVAVPIRSWKPVTVAVKTTTTLDLKPAT